LGEQMAVYVEKGHASDGREMFVKMPVKVDEAEGGKWVPILGGIDKGARVVVEGCLLRSGGSADVR